MPYYGVRTRVQHFGKKGKFGQNLDEKDFQIVVEGLLEAYCQRTSDKISEFLNVTFRAHNLPRFTVRTRVQ